MESWGFQVSATYLDTRDESQPMSNEETFQHLAVSFHTEGIYTLFIQNIEWKCG